LTNCERGGEEKEGYFIGLPTSVSHVYMCMKCIGGGGNVTFEKRRIEESYRGYATKRIDRIELIT